MNINKNIIVKGRVQGVGYRLWTKRSAEQLNIKGTVKNMPDGSVEIFASGNDKDIDRFVDWCQHGPAMASVSNVRVFETPFREYNSFSIL